MITKVQRNAIESRIYENMMQVDVAFVMNESELYTD